VARRDGSRWPKPPRPLVGDDNSFTNQVAILTKYDARSLLNNNAVLNDSINDNTFRIDRDCRGGARHCRRIPSRLMLT
jgi:hypothetical protein